MPALQPPILELAGATLRPWQQGDAVMLEEACGDERIRRFTTVPRHYTRAAGLAWVERQQAHAHAGRAVVLALVPAGEQRPAGMVGLFGLEGSSRTGRIGYWLLERVRGRGWATTAAQAIAAWGFRALSLRAIYIDWEPENMASARVAAKLGALEIGSHRAQWEGETVMLRRAMLDRAAFGGDTPAPRRPTLD